MTAIPDLPSAAPGSYVRGAATFPSLQAFLAERPERVSSRERDVGTRWREDGTLYRAAWIADTRELYLVQLGPTELGGGHVELLASELGARELERALRGWEKQQDASPDSLGWLRQKVLAARRPPARRRPPQLLAGMAWPAAALAAWAPALPV